MCIAVGVRTTACLPFLRHSEMKDTKLFWSSRKTCLITDLTSILNAFPSNVKVETRVGQQFDLYTIIYRELANHDSTNIGPLGLL
jgi:hypothetical protein